MSVLNTADALHLGTQTVDKMYAGTNLAWSRTFDPKLIPGLGLSLDATEITNLSDGDLVPTWHDSSPAGRHATAMDANQPRYRATALNGHPALELVSPTRMVVPGWGAALSYKTEYTLFQVIEQFGAYSNYPVITTGPSAGAWMWLTEFDIDGGVYWGHYNGHYRHYNTAFGTGTAHLLTYHFSASGPRFFVDGVEMTDYFISSGGDIWPTVPDIGADVLLGGYVDPSLSMTGYLGAVLWYDHALSDADRVKVENYLKSKWWGPPPTYDPDTAAYLAATGLGNSYAPALDNLVIDLKSAGLWTKMTAIYPFIGGTADLHKWNLKDPRDLDAAYRLNFNGPYPTHSVAGGYQPNPASDMATGWGDTHLIPAGTIDPNSVHLSLYSLGTLPQAPRCDMGAYNWDGSGGRFHLICHYTSGEYYYSLGHTGVQNVQQPGSGDGSGMYVSSRTGAYSETAYRNGVAIGSNGTPPVALPTVSVLVGALNSYPRECSDMKIGFSSIGSGLDARNTSDLYNIVQAYQTALHRQV